METGEKSTPRPGTARSRELGEELRRVRHRARMTSVSVAEELGWSPGKLSKLEAGSRGSTPWEIGALLGRCGADKPTRDRIVAIAGEPDTGAFLRRHDPSPDTLTALTMHEQQAVTLHAYEPLIVPSLAQTEDYVFALTADEALTLSRIARQGALRRRINTEMVFYIHEAALRLVVGDAAVMRDQLRHLVLMCGWMKRSPRIVPLTGNAHPALRHSGTLLTFANPAGPMAYVETDAVTVFLDDDTAVARYRSKMRVLDGLALTVEESRDAFARYANAYEREASRQPRLGLHMA